MTVLATGGQRWTLAIALVLVTPRAGWKWLNHSHLTLVPAPGVPGHNRRVLRFYRGTVAPVHSPYAESGYQCALRWSHWLPDAGIAVGSSIYTHPTRPDARRLLSPPDLKAEARWKVSMRYFAWSPFYRGLWRYDSGVQGQRESVVMETISGLFYMAVLVSPPGDLIFHPRIRPNKPKHRCVWIRIQFRNPNENI